jgi:hypothetical protein
LYYKLLESVESWLNSLDDAVDVILLDYAKAFDSVPHQRLLSKLRTYGISGNAVEWTKGFHDKPIPEGGDKWKIVETGMGEKWRSPGQCIRPCSFYTLCK